MPLLRDAPDDFAALVGRATRESGLDPAFVEKDYWVTELLRSLTKPIRVQPENLNQRVIVFKGGTSLSKAYQLIERFSEDVDILVVPPDRSTIGTIDRLLKNLVARAAEDLGIEDRLETSTRGVKRNVSFHYPAIHRSAALQPILLLEMGTRGGSNPSRDVTIRSYVGGIAARLGPEITAADIEQVSVRALAPERTLVEKLQLVHTAASRADLDPVGLIRTGRHLYDIHQLISSGEVMAALAAIPRGVAGLAEDIHCQSSAAGFESVRRPADGYAASPAFTEPNLRAAITEAYIGVEPLVWGRFPDPNEVLESISESAARL